MRRPPAFRARAPPSLRLDAAAPAAQPSPVPVLTPNPLFGGGANPLLADPDVASFAPLRDGATPRSGEDASRPPKPNPGRCAAPRAWDAALLFSAAAMTPAAGGWRRGGLAQALQTLGATAAAEERVSLADTRRRSHPGPLEASLSGLSAAVPPDADTESVGAPRRGSCELSQPAPVGQRQSAAPERPGSSPARQGASPTRARRGPSSRSQGAASVVAAAAERLRQLEARAGASVARAADALAALAAKKAGLLARQRASFQVRMRCTQCV